MPSGVYVRKPRLKKEWFDLCLQCGKEYQLRRRYWLGKQRFCSRACKDESCRNRVASKCGTCGKAISIRMGKFNRGEGKYCGKECWNKSQRGYQPWRVIPPGWAYVWQLYPDGIPCLHDPKPRRPIEPVPKATPEQIAEWDAILKAEGLSMWRGASGAMWKPIQIEEYEDPSLFYERMGA